VAKDGHMNPAHVVMAGFHSSMIESDFKALLQLNLFANPSKKLIFFDPHTYP
jgi:hypothetical protein